MILPEDDKARKDIPIYSGFIKYFPDAIVAVAKRSKEGNEQHNPGKELFWDRSKSGDELDSLNRHILEQDWIGVAWRAMANLQKHIEKEKEANITVEDVIKITKEIKVDKMGNINKFSGLEEAYNEDEDTRLWVEWHDRLYELCEESVGYDLNDHAFGQESGRSIMYIDEHKEAVYND